MPRRSVVGLAAALWAAGAAALAEPQAAHLGSYTWDAGGSGGYSGLELAENGLDFVIISDRGTVVSGRLARDAGGAVSGVAETSAGIVLRGADGAPLSRKGSNAEGLAIGPDGGLFISFELWHRVARYETPDALPETLPDHGAFADLESNAGLEALAIDATGALYTLAEGRDPASTEMPLYRFAQGVWSQPAMLPTDGAWLPVGADFGPDGRFYLLERSAGFPGFASRVRRFDLDAPGIGPGEVLLSTGYDTHDNLEGIAVWQDAPGAIRLTMISDDNFLFLQRTEFVDYVVAP